MKKEEIIKAVEAAVSERGCFIVDVTVSAANDIEIVLEKEEGIVDWNDCAAIDAVVHAAFDQDAEDYALTVSSAGLDRPFKVYRQFLKAVGSKVDVKFKGGRRLVATLTAATEDTVRPDPASVIVPVFSSNVAIVASLAPITTDAPLPTERLVIDCPRPPPIITTPPFACKTSTTPGSAKVPLPLFVTVGVVRTVESAFDWSTVTPESTVHVVEPDKAIDAQPSMAALPVAMIVPPPKTADKCRF